MIDQNTLKSLEDLHRLKNDGIITEEDFERSKQRLLFDSKPAAGQPLGTKTAVAEGPVARLFGTVPATLPAQNDFTGWMTLPLKKYADFTGRSTRKEFWMFQLIYLGLFFVGYACLEGGADASGEGSPIAKLIVALVCLALLALFVPLLAVEARRFRDINQSPWLVLINLFPYLGVFIVLIAMLIPGTQGENKYGPDPLAK